MLKVMIATKTYTPMRYVLYDLYTLRHSNHPTWPENMRENYLWNFFFFFVYDINIILNFEKKKHFDKFFLLLRIFEILV